MSKLFALTARIGGVGAAVLALAASTTEGDRSNAGRCPAGEQCADDTPEGLAFEGAQVSWFIGNGVAHTAVGGAQTVRITDNLTDAALDLPFTPKVTSAAHQVSVAATAAVTLSASAAGTGYLRITRVADGYLFDRLAIESRPIARMQARPTMNESWPGFGTESWAAWAGERVEVAVALYDSGGGWLIDESLEIASTVQVVRTAWDAAEILPLAAGTLELAVGAGDRNELVQVTVVDTLTQVSGPGPQTRAVGGTAEVCFQAFDGSVRVFGVPWSFQITGPGQALAAAEQDHPSCLELRTTGAGSITVTASIGNRSATGTVEVTGSAARTAPASGWVSRTDLGERAAAVGD